MGVCESRRLRISPSQVQFALGVPNTATNLALCGELGRVLLEIKPFLTELEQRSRDQYIQTWNSQLSSTTILPQPSNTPSDPNRKTTD